MGNVPKYNKAGVHSQMQFYLSGDSWQYLETLWAIITGGGAPAGIKGTEARATANPPTATMHAGWPAPPTKNYPAPNAKMATLKNPSP